MSGVDLSTIADRLDESPTLTPSDAAELLRELSLSDDHEWSHLLADQIMVAVVRGLGHGAVADGFQQLHKWYA